MNNTINSSTMLKIKAITYRSSSMKLLVLLISFCFIHSLNLSAENKVIPNAELKTVNETYAKAIATRSQARQRLSVRRVIRSAEALLKKYATAPNRFELLDTLFKARKQFIKLDPAPENRKALIDVCRLLVQAPNKYAEQRFEADILLCQTEQARKGASPSERVGALRPFIDRYRNTSVEKRMLQLITVMTLELGNDALLFDLRAAIAERFWHDLEMVRFKRDKLGGQVMSAPFVANLKASDGSRVVFPMDRLGRSTLFFVWSKDAPDLDKRITAWNTLLGTKTGPKDPNFTYIRSPELFDVVSLNLDELPDAGESILRKKGVDWQALHLPGGRKSEIYKTYIRWDPMGLHVSPTGCAALLLPGSHSNDYPRRVWSYMEHNMDYLRQLQSIFSGEFLVIDPVATFDPTFPPELKANGANNAKPLTRSADSVPVEVLKEIQASFIAAPLSYQLTEKQLTENYQKAEKLCRKAIASHPKAPELWMVYNRLIISLMGQWRMSCDPSFLTLAAKEADTALALKSPISVQIVPRLCKARMNMRDPKQNQAKVIKAFVEACGGEEKAGTAVAAACYLALDAGNRALHTDYRRVLLDKHQNNPMVWTITAALLDRHHRHQIFYHPYHRGWSFGRRTARYHDSGTPQDAHRILETNFKTLSGKSLELPMKETKTWNIIYFAQKIDKDSKKRMADLCKKGSRPGFLEATQQIVEKRNNVNLWIAFLEDDTKEVETVMADNPFKKQTLLVPNGIRNPMVNRLGIFRHESANNMAIIRPDGSIALVCSGYRPGSINVINNSFELADEIEVDAELAKGNKDEALRLALLRAPATKNDSIKKKKSQGPSLVHLRNRAKAYIATRKWELALADVDSLVDRQMGYDARMAVESYDLRKALALQAIVHKRLNKGKKQEEKN